ncbi:hypothetical protein SAMN04489752_1331 [Brevibacterium siliguriense]|uniref:SipW-cognate class signal peptide n=1 Tax=Brevibacterium siliguriense TaxID=1136497 RepID=A0A1H1QSH2_9MICO|nr:hypothetical protein [Brevibacterium siliguriense]SDS26428.1 hypothetical protein SAMN04489752_1331 [Brevibacterium siliguriense]
MSASLRFRRVLLAAFALSMATGFGAAAAFGGGEQCIVGMTDAAWMTEESGSIAMTAETVEIPDTRCEGRNAAPNLLHLAAPGEGLEVTEYLVTLTSDEAVGSWDTGTTPEGYPLISDAQPVRVPASTSAVAWGITGEWNHTWNGDVVVRSVGPGGWTSQPVRYTWKIGFDWLGMGYGDCSAAD